MGRILLLFLPKFPKQYSERQWRVIHFFFKSFGFSCALLQGLVIVMKKNKNLDMKKVKIVVANHTTLNDATVNCLLLPTKMIAKSSLANFPVFKTFLTLQRAVLIERPDCKLNKKTKFLKPEGKTSTEQIRESLKDPQTKITVCPEGTIAAPGIIMRYHTSVFVQGYPVYPVCIKYHTLLPVAWTTHHWLFVLFNSLVNPFGLCVVTVLDPQEKREDESYQDFADRVGQMMAEKLNYKYVKYSSKDWFYFSGKSDKSTDEYLKDFGWMGTLDQFCKKYKIFRWFGIKSYQVKHIVPTE